VLYNLLYPLSEYYTIFNVFKYITFRTVYGIITGLILSMVLIPALTKVLKHHQLSQKVKGYEPERHKKKEGTPTMGGVGILLSAALSTLLWADLKNPYIWIIIFVMVGTGIIGFYDDYVKTMKKNPEGIHPKAKFWGQVFVGTIAVILIHLVDNTGVSTKLTIPFLKLSFDLGYLYLFLGVFIIVGTSNAVNLTDGLDGLAIMPTVIAFGTFMIFAYVTGHAKIASYLQILNVKGAGEVTIFCGAMAGAGLGFLWYNAYPASLFMGDVGSLPLGATLGTVAIITNMRSSLQ